MVLVDTSIWISLFRKGNDEIGQKMWALVARNEAALCGQVWVEYVGGFRKQVERRKHEQSLKQFPFLETSRETFECAANLLADYPHLGAGDGIIAATAFSIKATLFTLDGDFKDLKQEGLELF